MPGHPGFVMQAPDEDRRVWVRLEDRAAWEERGYVVTEETAAVDPDAGGAFPPEPPPAAQEADSSPSESAPAAEEDSDEAEAPAEEPKPAVDYPRSRGRNTRPRA